MPPCLYCELIGSGALITIEHTPSQKNPGQFYSNIGSIAPVMEDLRGKIVPVDVFTLPGEAPAEGQGGEQPF